MKRLVRFSVAVAVAVAVVAACNSTPDYDPGVTASQFQKLVDNRFLPFPVGMRWVYTATTSEGLIRTEVEVLGDAKRVAWGVDVTVVRDTEYKNGEKIEDTWDWYAQHSDGSVWYMGEDTAEYENGEVVSREGAWEAGVDGALPGILMLAAPEVGKKYRQEFYEGEAEDYGEVEAVDAAVNGPVGSWTGCVKTHDTSAIDETLDEHKYYCRDVGLVLTEESGHKVELIRHSRP